MAPVARQPMSAATKKAALKPSMVVSRYPRPSCKNSGNQTRSMCQHRLTLTLTHKTTPKRAEKRIRQKELSSS